MKLAIATDAISADFETAVLLGLEWGIEHFELKRIHQKRIPDIADEEVQLVQKILEANAVTLSTLSPGFFKLPLGDPRIAEEAGPKFDRIVALADRLGTRSVIIFGFERDDRRDEDAALSQIVDILASLAARARREEITLFLENDRRLWAERPSALRRILTGVGSPALRLNWDPCNLIAAWPGKPYPDGYDEIREFVGHLHLKDAAVAPDGQMAHAMMGSGDVDWVGQFERLYREGYDGYCVIEPHYGSRVSSSRSHVVETRKLMRLARAHLKAAGSSGASTAVIGA